MSKAPDPKEQPPLDPKQVDFVSLKERTTRAYATFLLRSGYELPPAWEQDLAKLYAADVAEQDYQINEEAAKKKKDGK